jgi:hypothetical protein
MKSNIELFTNGGSGRDILFFAGAVAGMPGRRFGDNGSVIYFHGDPENLIVLFAQQSRGYGGIHATTQTNGYLYPFMIHYPYLSGQ